MKVEGVRVSVSVRVVDVFGCLAGMVMVSEVNENIKKYENRDLDLDVDLDGGDDDCKIGWGMRD